VKHREKIPKTISTSPNLEITFTWQIISCNTSCKKEKYKEADPNAMPKTLMPFNGQQKSMRRENLNGRPKGNQVKHLWGYIF
jgi:hypothetical protein